MKILYGPKSHKKIVKELHRKKSFGITGRPISNRRDRRLAERILRAEEGKAKGVDKAG